MSQAQSLSGKESRSRPKKEYTRCLALITLGTCILGVGGNSENSNTMYTVVHFIIHKRRDRDCQGSRVPCIASARGREKCRHLCGIDMETASLNKILTSDVRH
jgi:hypothetical protein